MYSINCLCIQTLLFHITIALTPQKIIKSGHTSGQNGINKENPTKNFILSRRDIYRDASRRIATSVWTPSRRCLDVATRRDASRFDFSVTTPIKRPDIISTQNAS